MSRILIALLLLRVIFAADPKVTLNHGGILVGHYSKTINGREISNFKGIPYAEPPVGDLRFKSPQPFPAWKGERSAINDTADCFQVEASVHGTTPAGQEDCLYLNVYVPNVPHQRKLPVMVWFHGGGWTYGSGSSRDYGPQYLLEKDIILVSGNYRLNIFGFLSSETLDCPGNFGLKDSVEILKWVNQHISSFGGDPSSVTIFGESSGSVSVMYLMHSNKSNRLFHRAIAQSGTYFNPYGQPHKKGTAAEKALRLAKWVNCEGDGVTVNWSQIIKCLRGIPGDTLIREFHKYYDWELFPTVPLLAVVEEDHEEAFITTSPKSSSSFTKSIPLMVGFNSEEGALFSAILLNSEELLSQLKDNFTALAPLIVHYNGMDIARQAEITRDITQFYLKDGLNFDLNNFENFTQIISDGGFFLGFDQFLRQRLTQKSRPRSMPITYAYVFNHRGDKSMTSFVGAGSKFFGVTHADEIQYLFPWRHILNITEPTFRDVIMKNAMVEMWTNFASFGNPTPRGCHFPKWDAVRGLPWNYARIGSTDLEDRQIIRNSVHFLKNRIEFWNGLKIDVN
ncbi:CES5A.2 family protein [Megaselia abdita]